MNDNEKLAGLIGLAKRAGKLACGDEQTAAAARAGQASLVIAAFDAALGTARKARRAAETNGTDFVVLPIGKQELGYAVGRGSCAVIAVCNRGFSREIKLRLEKAGGDAVTRK